MSNNTTITINKPDIDKIEKIKKENKLRNTNDVCDLLLTEHKWSKEKERTYNNKIKKYEEFIDLFFSDTNKLHFFMKELNNDSWKTIKHILTCNFKEMFSILLDHFKTINLTDSENYNFERFNWEMSYCFKLILNVINVITQNNPEESFLVHLKNFYYLFRKELNSIENIGQIIKKIKSTFEQEKTKNHWTFLDKELFIPQVSELDKLKAENLQLKQELKKLKNKKEG